MNSTFRIGLIVALLAISCTFQDVHGASSRVLKSQKIFGLSDNKNFQCLVPTNLSQPLDEQTLENVNVQAEVNKFTSSGTAHHMRNQLNDLLDDKRRWTTVDADYERVMGYLKGILKEDQKHLNRAIDIHSWSIRLKARKCFFANESSASSSKQKCAKDFKIIEPALMNFAMAADNKTAVPALYWLVSIMDKLPSLTQECLGTSFHIPRHYFDDDDCEDNMKDLADLIGKIAADPGELFGAEEEKLVRRNYPNARHMLKDYIPNIFGYCIGTDALLR